MLGMGRTIYDRETYEHWKKEWAKKRYTPWDVYEMVKAHGFEQGYLEDLRAVISEMEGCSPERGEEQT